MDKQKDEPIEMDVFLCELYSIATDARKRMLKKAYSAERREVVETKYADTIREFRNMAHQYGLIDASGRYPWEKGYTTPSKPLPPIP